MDLLKESKRWHGDATALLESTGLVKLLSQFGSVKFTGSYDYDLMLGSDIDIFLVTNHPSRENADEMAKALIDSGHWTSLMYCDWPTNDPKGPYFCLKQDFRNHRWKIDILTVTPEQIQDLTHSRSIYYHATDEQKKIIFEIKSARFRGEYPKDTSTIYIYDAVLKNGISNTKAFIEFLATLS